ncbi:DEAD/DEAH box helicase domain protein [Nitzschia inconspicua]|uniref:RNA helicase n=1 Tax=Nitzschia inconspicua TaxID=303405 RepID=A0A9K3PFL3_9STRA|nr:DEAD/DEAH box helicase domain protein [Nitzschia inconspicua]
MDDLSSTVVLNKALKVAKKSLKKQESMKLKDLSKLVAEKLDDDTTHKTVKKWILKSDQFSIDGKTVSLTKKRSKEESKEEIPSKKARKGDDTKSLTSVEEWRNDNKIVVKHAKDDDEGQKESKRIQQDETYFPFTTFEDCRALMESSLIRQCTDANKFQKPSPIQAQSWPILMHHKRDVVGIAETGSGKTLAFGIPALSSMSKESKSGRRLPRMLVLSPTRELAMQVETVLQEYGKVVGLTSLVLYGGVPKYTQVAELKKKTVDCLVATPGRLKDLINEGSCDLSKVQHLVLDEADRMLDMGFEEDVKFIISQCMPKEDGRQTAMFSATWPAAIQDIAMNYMIDPIRIYVGFEAIVGSNGENNIDDSLSANKRVEQHVEVIEDRMRDRRLRELLRQHQQSKQRILIFALYKKEAERLEHALNREGFNVCSIHGNKHQGARTQALSDFKDGKCQMMVATDVAARGLDIPDVELVVNYTFPLTIEDYVHRIGRTGRAGKTGISYTFFQPSDKSHAGELQQVIKQAGQEPPEELLKFGSTIKKKEHKLYGNFGPNTGMPMKKATKITFNYDD